jgi:PelA/Pel-15E family pectate lyase
MLTPATKSLWYAAVALSASSVFAEPVTTDRIGKLPQAERTAWEAYLERSRTLARVDQAALDAEVAANKLPSAIRAPSDGDFKLSKPAGDSWYAGDDARKLADTILSYQTPAGGWSKHLGFSKGPRQPGMQWTSQSEPGKPPHYPATFDNNSTTAELEFLANVWLATKRDDCKAAFTKGLNFVFAAQYPSGGWPQVYPLEGGYHDHVTFNDDAMTHVLELLDAITRNEPAYAFVDEPQRRKAADALASGLGYVLKSQVVRNGKKTVWCAQHDPMTLQPAGARKFEPATLSGGESAHVLRYLMTIRDPKPEVVAGIEAGLAWLEEAKVTGIGKKRENGRTTYVADPMSTQVYWARFYSLETGKPVFPGRDGVLYDSFVAMAGNNDIGYDYYTTLPGSILGNGQKKWRKMLETRGAK